MKIEMESDMLFFLIVYRLSHADLIGKYQRNRCLLFWHFLWITDNRLYFIGHLRFLF